VKSRFFIRGFIVEEIFAINIVMSRTRKWTSDELKKISGADDLKISPFREDGKTYGTPTWIWNVAVKGELYVRAYHGIKSRWYQAALMQKAGQIHAAGMVKKVSFEPVAEAATNGLIDLAYTSKYKGNPFVPAMVSEKVKLATIKIIPAEK
jgi:hypothetical protein